jgi:hypothetical protein
LELSPPDHAARAGLRSSDPLVDGLGGVARVGYRQRRGGHAARGRRGAGMEQAGLRGQEGGRRRRGLGAAGGGS